MAKHAETQKGLGMSKVDANRYAALVGLLCVALVVACGEPRCPGGYIKKGGTCYRIKKDGGVESTEAVESEDETSAGDAAGSSDDASAAAASEADPPRAPGASDAGTGMMTGVDAAPTSATPAFDGGGQSEAAVVDAGAMTCAAPPCGVESDAAGEAGGEACATSGGCQPGDACVTDAECRSGGSSTATCDPTDKVCVDVCGTQTIISQANLDAARYCKEIAGDLILQPNFATLPASELPYLTRVRGDVKGADSSTLPSAAVSITLGRLETVDGGFGLTGFPALSLVSAPRLTTAGSFVFALRSSTIERISAPQLSRVDGNFGLWALERLTQVDIGKLNSIGGQVQLISLCMLPWSQVERISLLGSSRQIMYVGCCIRLSQHTSCTTSNSGCSCGG